MCVRGAEHSLSYFVNTGSCEETWLQDLTWEAAELGPGGSMMFWMLNGPKA